MTQHQTARSRKVTFWEIWYAYDTCTWVDDGRHAVFHIHNVCMHIMVSCRSGVRKLACVYRILNRHLPDVPVKAKAFNRTAYVRRSTMVRFASKCRMDSCLRLKVPKIRAIVDLFSELQANVRSQAPPSWSECATSPPWARKQLTQRPRTYWRLLCAHTRCPWWLMAQQMWLLFNTLCANNSCTSSIVVGFRKWTLVLQYLHATRCKRGFTELQSMLKSPKQRPRA